jgi:hypothetical protein
MDRFLAAEAAARCFAEAWFCAILDVCHRLAPRRHRVLNRPQRFIRLAHETGSATISSLYLPCFHMPFRLPLGPPLPGAPPFIRHLPFGVAGDWQGVPRRVSWPSIARVIGPSMTYVRCGVRLGHARV